MASQDCLGFPSCSLSHGSVIPSSYFFLAEQALCLSTVIAGDIPPLRTSLCHRQALYLHLIFIISINPTHNYFASVDSANVPFKSLYTQNLLLQKAFLVTTKGITYQVSAVYRPTGPPVEEWKTFLVPRAQFRKRQNIYTRTILGSNEIW